MLLQLSRVLEVPNRGPGGREWLHCRKNPGAEHLSAKRQLHGWFCFFMTANDIPVKVQDANHNVMSLSSLCFSCKHLRSPSLKCLISLYISVCLYYFSGWTQEDRELSNERGLLANVVLSGWPIQYGFRLSFHAFLHASCYWSHFVVLWLFSFSLKQVCIHCTVKYLYLKLLNE